MTAETDEHGSGTGSARAAGGRLGGQTFASFGLRDFRLLWGNNFSYALVQGIQRFVFVWMAGELTEHNLLLGLMAFAIGIPVLFLSLPVGVLSDRWNRRLLLIGSQVFVLAVSLLAAALIWMGLVDAGLMSMGILLALALLMGAGTAIGQPVRQALVPVVVPRERLMNAITLNSTGQTVSQIAGPLLGGAAIEIWGNGGAFALQALLMALGLLFLLPLRLPTVERFAHAGGDWVATVRTEIGEGLGFVRRTGDIRTLLILLMATSLVIMGPWQALLPRIAETQLDATALRASAVLGVMGVGSLVSSLVLASIPRLANAGGWFTCTLIIGGSLAVGIGLSHSYWLTMLLMLLSGLNAGFFINLNLTLIQSHTPGDVMGRVMSIYTLILMGGSPFGGLLAGGGAQLLGAGAWFSICGGAMAAVAAVFLLTQGSLRRMPSHPETPVAAAAERGAG